jgi:cobalt/nickel transport protein
LKTRWKYFLLIAVTVALFAVPFLLGPGREFSGTDDQAEQMIKQIHAGYEPWTKPIWKPPSDEIETLLFCVQGGLGALVIGYCIGIMRSSQKSNTFDASKD